MSLTTTELSNHFGIIMSADFITGTLKVPNTGKDKRASLWDNALLPKIGAALAKHAKARGDATPAEKVVKPKVEKAAAAESVVEDNSDLF